MTYSTINVDESDGRATVMLDRPTKLNAMTFETFVELEDAFTKFQDHDLDIVTVRGVEGNFSAGVDMSNVPEWAERDPIEIRNDLERMQSAFRSIEALDVPVIAALEGYVLGGGLELAISCDIRVARTDAEFALPEADLGLAMNLGGAEKLPGLIGEGMAKYLVMTGRKIDAQRAYNSGLVEMFEPGDEFETTVTDLENDLAGKPTYVLGLGKRQIHSVRPLNLEEAMKQAIYHAIAAYGEEETIRRSLEFLSEDDSDTDRKNA